MVIVVARNHTIEGDGEDSTPPPHNSENCESLNMKLLFESLFCHSLMHCNSYSGLHRSLWNHPYVVVTNNSGIWKYTSSFSFQLGQ